MINFPDKQTDFRELKGLLSEHMKTIATFSAGLVFTRPWTRNLPYIKGKGKKN